MDASRARSHDPVMSGTLVEACCARATGCADISATMASGKMILFEVIVASLLFRRPLKRVCGRNRQFLRLAAGKGNFKKQAGRLSIKERRKYDLHFVAGFDHVRASAKLLQHVDACTF